jgi:hypothetical protein
LPQTLAGVLVPPAQPAIETAAGDCIAVTKLIAQMTPTQRFDQW